MKYAFFFLCTLMTVQTNYAQKPEVIGQMPVEYNTTSNNDARVLYIRQFSGIAQREMERKGIPASIKLAQAILESNSGQSTLAREANNHFGIKCHKDWNGKTHYRKDDDRDPSGNLIESCFRNYKRAEESYEDHTAFLANPSKKNRYGSLFELDRRDYKSWAYGLKAAGYATSDTYAESLIRIIEQYNLHAYDNANYAGGDAGSGNDLPSPDGGPVRGGTGSRQRNVGQINDVKAIRASGGQTLQDLARRYGLSPQKVACYNDCQIAVTQVLRENEIVFLSKKRKKWRGKVKEIAISKDETMFDIAQRYGIKLMKLYEINGMPGGTEPVAGQAIRLKGRKRTDTVKIRRDIAIKPPVVTQPRSANGTVSSVGGSLPTTPDPSPYKPTNGELFEIGEGGTVTTQPPSGSTDAPRKPTTTGSTRPDIVPTNQPSTTPSVPDISYEAPVRPVTPPPVTQPSTPKPTNQPPAQAPAGYHTVVKGDTLYNISKKYNTTVERLRELNSLANNDIKLGQFIKVK
jgi:flagellum-specific peptidoglycan hydrolase FlgJ